MQCRQRRNENSVFSLVSVDNRAGGTSEAGGVAIGGVATATPTIFRDLLKTLPWKNKVPYSVAIATNIFLCFRKSYDQLYKISFRKRRSLVECNGSND